MFLEEIVNATPLVYKWISRDVASFEMDEALYGIILESNSIQLPERTISIVNITFGQVIDTNKKISSTNINRSLTGAGKPRTVMSTVAKACLENDFIKQHDMFVVAASDQVKEKRIGIYGLVLTLLSNYLKEYKYSYRAHTPNNSILVVDSKIKLTQDEVEFIGTQILGK